MSSREEKKQEIIRGIISLKERKGSMQKAIAGYLKSKGNEIPKRELTVLLTNMIQTGMLTYKNERYKINFIQRRSSATCGTACSSQCPPRDMNEGDLQIAAKIFAEFKMTFLEQDDRQKIWDSDKKGWGNPFQPGEQATQRIILPQKGTIKGLVHCFGDCDEGFLQSCTKAVSCIPVIGRKLVAAKPMMYYPFEGYVESKRGDFFPTGGNIIANWKRRWPLFKHWLQQVKHVGPQRDRAIAEARRGIQLLEQSLIESTGIQVGSIGERTLQRIQTTLASMIPDQISNKSLYDFWKEIGSRHNFNLCFYSAAGTGGGAPALMKYAKQRDQQGNVIVYGECGEGTLVDYHTLPGTDFVISSLSGGWMQEMQQMTVGDFITSKSLSLPQLVDFFNDYFVVNTYPGMKEAKDAVNEAYNNLLNGGNSKTSITLLDLFLSKKITGVGTGVVMPDTFRGRRGGAPLLLTAIASQQPPAEDANPNGARSIFKGSTKGQFALQPDLNQEVLDEMGKSVNTDYVEMLIIGAGTGVLQTAMQKFGVWVQISLPSVPHLVNVIIRNGNIYTFGGGYNSPCINLSSVGIPYEYGDMWLMSPDGLILEDIARSTDPMNNQKIVAWGIYNTDIQTRLRTLLHKVNHSGKAKSDGMYKVAGEKYSAVSNWFLNSVLGWSNCVVTGRCVIQGQGQSWGNKISGKFIVLPWDDVGGLDVNLLFEIVRTGDVNMGGGFIRQKGGDGGFINFELDEEGQPVYPIPQTRKDFYNTLQNRVTHNPLVSLKKCAILDCPQPQQAPFYGGGRRKRTKRRRKRKTKRKRHGKKRVKKTRGKKKRRGNRKRRTRR
jgi:hypothetical protein